jgi:outer membrane lipoprotein-sorting protein
MRYILSTLLLCVTLTGFSQTVSDIITKHITAVGGKEAWKAIKTYTVEGNSTMIMQSVNVKMYCKNTMSRNEISFMGMRMVTAFDGKRAWMINPLAGSDSAIVLSEEDSKAIAASNFMQDVFFNDSILKFNITLIGKEKVGDEQCFVLQLLQANAPLEKYYVSTTSFLIMKHEVVAKLDNKQESVIITYSNFKKEAGLILARTIALPVGVMNITSVKFNAELNNSLFEIPNGK